MHTPFLCFALYTSSVPIYIDRAGDGLVIIAYNSLVNGLVCQKILPSTSAPAPLCAACMDPPITSVVTAGFASPTNLESKTQLD